MGGDTTRSFSQFWLCLNWGKASKKKTWCAGLQAVKTSHGGSQGCQALSLSPAERLWTAQNLPFGITDKACNQELIWPSMRGLERGRGAFDAGDQLKGFAWGGTRRVQYGAAIPLDVGGHPGWAVDTYHLLAGRRTAFNTHTFLLLFFLSFVMGVGRAVVRCSFQGEPHPWWALSPWLLNHREWFTPRGEEGLLPESLWQRALLGPGHTHPALPIPHLSTEVLRGSGYPMCSRATNSSPASQYLAGTVWALSASRITTQ